MPQSGASTTFEASMKGNARFTRSFTTWTVSICSIDKWITPSRISFPGSSFRFAVQLDCAARSKLINPWLWQLRQERIRRRPLRGSKPRYPKRDVNRSLAFDALDSPIQRLDPVLCSALPDRACM